MVTQPQTIAVIGSGISGICSAYLLQREHTVTLFEKNDYIGGHTNTMTIPDGPDEGTAVDTGFIVLNQRTYPNFIKFLDQLNVTIKSTDMSFGYHCKESGLSYATRNLNTIFAQRINVLKPGYWLFLYEMVRFIKTIRKEYLSGTLPDITLGDYILKKRYHQSVARQFILPMASAIWSGSDMSIQDFPVRTFAQFYENHGLLALADHPPWYVVDGGSQTYVKAFLNGFQGTVVKHAGIKSIRRKNGKVVISFDEKTSETFDSVVIATHADQALALLEDPTPDEIRLLGPWRYSLNETWLHTDESFMPPQKRAWASWNYIREKAASMDSPVPVTYDMNRLQHLKTTRNYFVTLNPGRSVNESTVVCKMDYTHPQYSFEAFETQNELDTINGQRRTYFCGSYFGYGFHEDGVKSAVEVGKKFGISL